MARGRRRKVRCSLCTPHRWLGNHKNRLKPKDQAALHPKHPKEAKT